VKASLLFALVLLAIPAVALADNSWSGTVPAKARALADRGRAFHDAGDYASAIAAFTQAYAMAPSPALLFNLAQSYRLQGNCDDASVMYQRYIATNPSPEGRALAETHLASVERCMHKIALHIPADAGARVELPAPAASIVVTSGDRAGSHKAQLEKDVGLGLAIGGSAALVAAAFYAVRANNAADEVTNANAKGGKGKDIAPIDQRGQSAASNARLLAIGGGVGIVGGIVMYALGKRAEAAPVTVTPTGRGASVSMQWAF
jgi:tetratricopeptide (TPR) repeat protein